jgi:DNA-binding transcriptional regulator LsrR (DeoR family)
MPFNLGMTQAQLAEELGTVREVVVRGLAQLRRDGIIAAAGRGRYVISNRDGLTDLALS